jgi:hypothetical protein
MMKKAVPFFLFVALLSCFAFTTHKFYTAIYQINFVPNKKMVQITTRIFADDLNAALEHKFRKKTSLGTKAETTEDVELLKKYLAEKFTIKIDGKLKTMNFHSKELEDNILICYLSCKDISKITSLEVENTIITEIHGEQQNIIQANFNNKKGSLLLGSEIFKGMLK